MLESGILKKFDDCKRSCQKHHGLTLRKTLFFLMVKQRQPVYLSWGSIALFGLRVRVRTLSRERYLEFVILLILNKRRESNFAWGLISTLTSKKKANVGLESDRGKCKREAKFLKT